MDNFIVYKLIDKVNDLIYIGLTCRNLNRRWSNHCLINRFGHSNFDKEILISNLTIDEAREEERKAIAKFDSSNPDIGYNMNYGGSGPGHLTIESKRKISESLLGMSFTEEHKKNISSSLKGRSLSEECKKKLSDSRKGYKHTEESKKRMSESRKGGKRSEETKRKISEAQSGEKHPMYGKKHSEETKRKMSESRSGIRNPNYGKPQSIETKKKNCESNSKLTEKEVLEIRNRYNSGDSQNKIAKDYNVSRGTIFRIINRISWKHLP